MYQSAILFQVCFSAFRKDCLGKYMTNSQMKYVRTID